MAMLFLSRSLQHIKTLPHVDLTPRLLSSPHLTATRFHPFLSRNMSLYSLSWLTHNISIVAASFILFCIVLRVIYQLVFSPLSAIPGPWYAAVSDFWLTTHVLRLQQCKTVDKLFQVYGPVVRVGPNKIVFRDVTSMRSVYSVHKFDKSTYYKSLLT